MKRTSQNLSEISAEMLINYLYPEMEERWKVQNMGTFYRNYNRDVLTYDEENAEIQVARDGFQKLLPQGMLFTTRNKNHEDLKNSINEQNAKMRLLRDLFQPFDTFAFRRRLAVERQISLLLDTKLHYLLSTYFHYDLSKEENPYVREVAVLLPFVSDMRGDFMFIRNLLSSLFECEVQCFQGRYSNYDNTRSWIPMMQYELLIEHLTNEEYNNLSKDMEPLIQFITEWFVPAEVHCEIMLKWHQQPPLTGKNLTLNYNTELNK